MEHRPKINSLSATKGLAPGQIGFDGSNVTFGGVLIGTATGGSGGADLVVSLSANADAAAVSALLNNATYENTAVSNPTTGARLVTFALDDGDGGVSASNSVGINVVSAATAVIRDEFNSVSYSNNDGSVNWSNSWTELGESTNPASGFVEVDSSADALEIGSGPTLLLFATDISGLGAQRSADLSSAHDATLSLDAWKAGVGSGHVSVQVSSNGSSWTTLANLDFNTLSTSRTNFSYDISAYMSATTSVRLVGSGSVGGVLLSGHYWLDNISINYTPNTAPVLAATGGIESFTENLGPVVVDNGISVFDADSPDFDGGSLTVDFASGGTANDRLSLQNQGTGPGQVGVSGSNLTYGGVNIGTFSGGSDGSTPFTVTFNSNADATVTEAVARAVTYDNTSEDPSTVARSIRFVASDGDGGVSSSVSRSVGVTAVNDAPVASSIEAGALAYTENDGAVAITSSIAFTDVDDTNIESATIQISSGYTSGEDTLIFTNQNGISGSFNPVSGILSLSGTASLSDYETAIRSVNYSNTSDNPSTTTRTISFTVNDGDANSNTLTRSITIANLNDDPTNSGSLPTDVSVTEDLLSNIDLSAVNFSDIDAGGSSVTITLSTSAGGELSLAGNGSLIFGGTSTARTITGSLADLNNYFNTASNIQYLHGTANTNGDNADTITVFINDNGNTGAGGGTDQTLGTVNVDITAVNDEEVLATNTSTTVAEGSTGTVLTTAMLHTTDVDNTDAQLVYTVDAVTS